MKPFLDALSQIKGDPLTLVGYVCFVAAWLVIALNSRKARALFRTINSLPEKDRLAALSLEYRASPKAGLTAEQWIQSRIHLYLFSGFAITTLLLLALGISAIAYSQNHRALAPIAPCTTVGTNTTYGDNSPIVPCNSGTINSATPSIKKRDPMKEPQQP